MIRSLQIVNFKSFRDASLVLAPLTLLIGANASGKSNALEALKLLAWIAGNGRLAAIQVAMKEHELRVRGGVQHLVPIGTKAPRIGLGCTVDGPDDVGKLEFSIKLESKDDGLHVAEESLTAPKLQGLMNTQLPLYQISSSNQKLNLLWVEYNNFKRGRTKPQINATDQQAVFVQLVSPAPFAKHPLSADVIPRATSALQKYLSAILFLDPNPTEMRGYSYKSDRRIQSSGANVSAVLFDLCEVLEQKPAVLDFIRSLPEQDISDIRFVPTPREEVMVELIETFGPSQQPCDASLLSDGTLRVLAIAAALLSVEGGTLVIIEEIDNGVHPSRAQLLLRRIRDVAEKRGLRVLLTTHNPALLDALPPASLGDVTVCYRDPKAGDSRLMRLRDLSTFPAVVAQGPLGQLVTQGVIDRYVKARKDADQDLVAELAWVDSLAEGDSNE